jgi:hypothetical protein
VPNISHMKPLRFYNNLGEPNISFERTTKVVRSLSVKLCAVHIYHNSTIAVAAQLGR